MKNSDKIYETVYVRTMDGQIFFDIVISDKSPSYLARKWKISVAAVRHYRLHGRKAIRSKKYRVPYYAPAASQKGEEGK